MENFKNCNLTASKTDVENIQEESIKYLVVNFHLFEYEIKLKIDSNGNDEIGVFFCSEDNACIFINRFMVMSGEEAEAQLQPKSISFLEYLGAIFTVIGMMFGFALLMACMMTCGILPPFFVKLLDQIFGNEGERNEATRLLNV